MLHENASAKPDSGIPESGANAAKPEKRGTLNPKPDPGEGNKKVEVKPPARTRASKRTAKAKATDACRRRGGGIGWRRRLEQRRLGRLGQLGPSGGSAARGEAVLERTRRARALKKKARTCFVQKDKDMLVIDFLSLGGSLSATPRTDAVARDAPEAPRGGGRMSSPRCVRRRVRRRVLVLARGRIDLRSRFGRDSALEVADKVVACFSGEGRRRRRLADPADPLLGVASLLEVVGGDVAVLS